MLPTRVAGLLQSAYLASPWLIICQSATTSVTSSAGARTPCTHSESSDVMQWAVTHWRLSTSRWCWPSYSTLPRLAGFYKLGWQRPDRSVCATWSKTLSLSRHWSHCITTCWRCILTTNYSEQFGTILNISSITCCQTELIIHIHSDLAGTTALSVKVDSGNF